MIGKNIHYEVRVYTQIRKITFEDKSEYGNDDFIKDKSWFKSFDTQKDAQRFIKKMKSLRNF